VVWHHPYFIHHWTRDGETKPAPFQGHRQGSESGGLHREHGAPAYNKGLGAEISAGSRGKWPGSKAPEVDSFFVLGCPTEW